MEKGDIFKGRTTRHPIVFLKTKNQDEFIGCIITHSTSEEYSENIGFRREHFCEKDELEKFYEVRYTDSYLVKLSLEKKNDWGPFLKKGKLTELGIEYVEENLKNTDPVSWEYHMGR